MKNKTLSIAIPVYNEKNTIEEILARVRKVDVGLNKQIVIVDDYSTDGTREMLDGLKDENTKIILQPYNQGKGAALKRGFQEVAGDFVIIQDADLEYDPQDYKIMLEPVLKGRADVVYGSRFRGTHQRVLYFWHYVGNKFLTLLSNMFTNLNLTDMETCYKLFRKEVIDEVLPKLKSKRFGIEPEITAKVAHRNWRIYEVPINYYGRTYAEGKKINWKDGLKAIFAILYFNLWDR